MTIIEQIAALQREQEFFNTCHLDKLIALTVDTPSDCDASDSADSYVIGALAPLVKILGKSPDEDWGIFQKRMVKLANCLRDAYYPRGTRQ